MAITPPSDIVLDVARAADPDRYRTALERLARLRESASDPQEFQVPAARPASEPSSTSATPVPASRPLNVGAASQVRRPLDAYGQFEAFVLQTFVQSMLPKNAVSVFGQGSAGEFWKSMLAEKVGDELARSGQVGIARRLAAGPNHSVQPSGMHAASSLAPPVVSTLTPPLTAPAEQREALLRTDVTIPLSEGS